MFSTNWILKYGVPSTYSFACEAKNKQIEGYGAIISVQKGAIRVKNADKTVSALNIGNCSSLFAEK